MDYLDAYLNALAATLGLPALTLDAQGLRSIALDQDRPPFRVSKNRP